MYGPIGMGGAEAYSVPVLPGEVLLFLPHPSQPMSMLVFVALPVALNLINCPVRPAYAHRG